METSRSLPDSGLQGRGTRAGNLNFMTVETKQSANKPLPLPAGVTAEAA